MLSLERLRLGLVVLSLQRRMGLFLLPRSLRFNLRFQLKWK
jgi:hypothetical protein